MKKYFGLLLILSALYSKTYAQNSKSASAVLMKKHISYLASDQLEGRLTGSTGEQLSADYIEKSFKEAGLQPVQVATESETNSKNIPASYQHTFPFVKLRITTNNSKFRFVGTPDMPGLNADLRIDFTVFKDFYPIAQSNPNDSITLPTADCGYGIVHEKSGRNDFAEFPDLTGKICVMRLGYLDEVENPHSPIAEVADIQTKIAEAIKRNARGIIFIKGLNTPAKSIPSGKLGRSDKTLEIPIFFYNSDRPVPPRIHVTMISKVAAPTTNAINVMGFRNNHKKATIIICAHHDHIGYNEYENSRYTGQRSIHNGADDNASGVAAMLELARTLKGKKYKKYNYLFIAFSGEELGLLGSKFFVNHAPIILAGKTKDINTQYPKNPALSRVTYVVNIDMLGRLDSAKKILAINGVGTSPQFPISISKLKLDTNAIRITTTESGLGPSDHASFYIENIPVVHFFTGQHDDYHKPSDDENKINYQGMVNSVDAISQFIAITNKSKKITFNKTKDVTPGRMRFKVSLGVMPDYTYSGKGMRIDGATDGKPAQKAGLTKGDVITKLGDTVINSIEDYMGALGKLEPNSTVNVTLIRGTETIVIPVVL